MITLSPSGGELIATDESTFVSETITASGDGTPITLWEWQFSPETDNFEVTPDGDTLTVAYVSSDGLFPFSIIYLDQNNNSHIATKWENIPDISQSPEIIAMLASLTNTRTWNLTVTANGADIAVGNYTIKVEANYTANRNILVEQVDLRR